MVAVLLAAAVIGLRARGSFPDQASSSLADAGGTVIAGIFTVAEGAGLVACVLVLTLVLRRPRRRNPEDEAQPSGTPQDNAPRTADPTRTRAQARRNPGGAYSIRRK